jgi:hypothetical protein
MRGVFLLTEREAVKEKSGTDKDISEKGAQ